MCEWVWAGGQGGGGDERGGGGGKRDMFSYEVICIVKLYPVFLFIMLLSIIMLLMVFYFKNF